MKNFLVGGKIKIVVIFILYRVFGSCIVVIYIMDIYIFLYIKFIEGVCKDDLVNNSICYF